MSLAIRDGPRSCTQCPGSRCICVQNSMSCLDSAPRGESCGRGLFHFSRAGKRKDVFPGKCHSLLWMKLEGSRCCLHLIPTVCCECPGSWAAASHQGIFGALWRERFLGGFEGRGVLFAVPEESPPHLLAEIFRHVVIDEGIGTAVEGADGQAHHVADVQVAVQLGVIAGVVNKEENVAGRVEGHQHEQHKSRELDRVGVFPPAAQEGSQHRAVAEQHHQQRSEESAGDQAGEVVEVKPLVLVPGEHVVAEGDVRAVQGVRLLLQCQRQREDGSAEPDGSAGAGSERRGAERA